MEPDLFNLIYAAVGGALTALVTWLKNKYVKKG